MATKKGRKEENEFNIQMYDHFMGRKSPDVPVESDKLSGIELDRLIEENVFGHDVSDEKLKWSNHDGCWSLDLKHGHDEAYFYFPDNIEMCREVADEYREKYDYESLGKDSQENVIYEKYGLLSSSIRKIPFYHRLLVLWNKHKVQKYLSRPLQIK